MKHLVLVIAVLAVPTASQAGTPATGASASMVERGKYIVSTSACNDCHTPKRMGPNGPEMDTTRLLSGHPDSEKLPPPPALPAGPWIAVASWDLAAWSGPWGVSYPMNLTPDENTGIGSWSEETFVNAIRTGKHMGVSRPILPPMPWDVYKNWTDEDIKAVYAYLRTIPPITNRIPDPVPPAQPSAAPKK